MIKKAKIKGGSDLLLGGLLLAYIGTVYQAYGFGMGLIYMLGIGMVAVSLLFTAAFRRLGSLALWLGAAGSYLILWYTARDLATATLIWGLCCAVPVGVSLVWPVYPRIDSLAARALPITGGIAILGTLVYSRLHFGSWSCLPMAKRMTLRIELFIDQTGLMYEQFTTEEQLTQLQAMLQFLKANSAVLAFGLIQMTAFLLLGIFFLSVWRADRKAQKDGLGRMLGSWRALYPSPAVSRLYMFGYLVVVLFGSGKIAQNLIAAFDLFGFFFVFVALHRLLQFLRKRGLPSWAKKAVIGGLFVLAYLSVGNALLSPYMILLYAGWWIAAFPMVITVIKK